MIACLQRVTRAAVHVDGECVGRIDRGILALVGVTKADDEADADRLAQRVAGYRIFPSEDGSKPIDRSVLDLELGILAVSQFTLCANTRKGMRPSFEPAAEPARANELYERFVEGLRKAGVARVETGRFRASMQVELVNDGPVTIFLDTAQKR